MYSTISLPASDGFLCSFIQQGNKFEAHTQVKGEGTKVLCRWNINLDFIPGNILNIIVAG